MDINSQIEKVQANKVYEGIFNIFELELEEISRFVAFTESNMSTYSNKIHELHLRVCSEIENILKIIVHEHFETEDKIKVLWQYEKSAFLKTEVLNQKFEEIKSVLNKEGKAKLDKYLFGFPDFAFYFKIACEKFNLHKKVVKFKAIVSDSLDWQMIQAFKLEDNQDVPYWWTCYNKLKHDKINNYYQCTLGDLIRSMSGFYILMNFLLKYQQNNSPTKNRNYVHYKEKGLLPSNEHEFCSLQSKLFEALVAIQVHVWWMILPPIIDKAAYENTKISAFDFLRPGMNYISDFKFENLTLAEIDLMSASIEFVSPWVDYETSIFYAYVDYFDVVNRQNVYFKQLGHFARFSN